MLLIRSKNPQRPQIQPIKRPSKAINNFNVLKESQQNIHCHKTVTSESNPPCYQK